MFKRLRDYRDAFWRRMGASTRRGRTPKHYLRALVGAAFCVAVASVVAAGDADVSATDARLDQVLGEHQAYRSFLEKLQAAVAADERAKVAELVSYPLRTRIDGRAVRVRTPAEFLKRYDALVPPGTRTRIAAQTYQGLFANSQGAMIGDGQLWFAAVCTDRSCASRSVRIIAFNP